MVIKLVKKVERKKIKKDGLFNYKPKTIKMCSIPFKGYIERDFNDLLIIFLELLTKSEVKIGRGLAFQDIYIFREDIVKSNTEVILNTYEFEFELEEEYN